MRRIGKPTPYRLQHKGQGRGTMVSVPPAFLDRNGLEAGSEVWLYLDDDGRLIVSPSKIPGVEEPTGVETTAAS